VREVFDLSPYCGRNVWIRFEYLTDEAINRPGLCLDDLRIPELDYACDAETSDDGWVAAGFVRTDNVLPLRYVVQLIRIADSVSVERIVLDQQQLGTVSLRQFVAGQKAVLVISAVTPVTAEVARYHYQIRPLQ
jgi:immune inhibitor A